MVQRWEDLRAGGHAATMLSGPYDLIAEAAGFRVLARAPDVIGRYQGNVAAARRSWAAAHPDQVSGFITAYVSAVRWLQMPEHRTAAVETLVRHVPGMSEPLALASATILPGGFFPDGRISREGAQTVLDLRRRHLPGSRALPDLGLYLDERYREAAI
jgi:ABC-type nitrate/sulfonate/bicarbonate transport system substrate-binding protein